MAQQLGVANPHHVIDIVKAIENPAHPIIIKEENEKIQML